MSHEHHDDELTPEQTEGFKVGQKKTIDEYQQLGRSKLFTLNNLHVFMHTRIPFPLDEAAGSTLHSTPLDLEAEPNISKSTPGRSFPNLSTACGLLKRLLWTV